MRIVFHLACLSSFAAGYPLHAAAQASQALGARIDSVAAQALAARDIPGAAVAFLRNDSVIVARGYGVADRARGTPVTTETIFQIASLTKPFTAMAVLMLVEEGKLGLDAPVSRYLDWLPAAYATVTVRQLLQHTGGVAPDMRRANVDEMTEAEFRNRFAASTPSFAPGTGWQYANAGYTLLSLVVERVSGQPFGEFLSQRIFQPLRMSSSSYRTPEREDDRHAIGYDIADGVLARAPHVFSGWGNSGIETTVTDLTRWVAAIHRKELLTPASYSLMFAPAKLAADTAVNFAFRAGRASYGLGWFLMTHQGEPLISHGGAIAGFSSVVNRLPSRNWTIIVLSNGKQGADRQGQAEALAGVLLEAIQATTTDNGRR